MARQLARPLGNGWRLLGPPGGDTQASLAVRVSAAFDAAIAAHLTKPWPSSATAALVAPTWVTSWAVSPECDASFAFHDTAMARVSVRPATR
ncbi:MAG: hypothetical protein IT318_00005 [Anaerolineales bacterium]|nr:hypothetical protein [Anaerolineales bacterium]